MASINLHLYQGAFRHETRILKQTRSIFDAGLFDKIIVATFWEKGLPEVEVIDGYLEVNRIKTFVVFQPNGNGPIAKIALLLDWYIRVLWKFGRSNLSLACVHSIETLGLGVLLKSRSKCKLIYDAHELETEKVGLSGKMQKIYKNLEKRLIYKTDAVFVVSETIKSWYFNEYPNLTSLSVIKNVPYVERNYKITPSTTLKDKFNIPRDKLLFIYQGGLFPSRFIENLLNVFAEIPDKHIVFMGYGNLSTLISQYAAKFSNIHLHPAVHQKDILNYTSSADIGLAVGENVCLSYYYSLPNKLFEYLLSGIPILACNWPEMSRMVNEYNCGWVAESTINDFRLAIQFITRQEWEMKKENVIKTAGKFGWHLEVVELLAVYHKLIKK